MEILTELGFTKYQTKIIKELTKLNKATAMQITKKTKIPSNKVYQTINELIKTNLIIETPTSPKQYSLSNLDTYLKNQIKQKQENVYKLENQYDKFLSEYKTPTQSEEFWVLNDLNSLLSKIEETYPKINTESIAIIEMWAARYSTLKIAKQTIKEGKRIRFLGKITTQSIPHVKKWLEIGAEIKHSQNINNAGFSVFDNNALKISLNSDSLKSIWSENQDLANILKDYFEILWQKATPVTLENLNQFK